LGTRLRVWTAIFRVVVIVACGVSWARGQGARQPLAVTQQFKQWDRNGDGTLTADGVPAPRLFQMLDRNRHGAVTIDEAKAFRAGDPRGAVVEVGPFPEPAGSASSPCTRKLSLARSAALSVLSSQPAWAISPPLMSAMSGICCAAPAPAHVWVQP